MVAVGAEPGRESGRSCLKGCVVAILVAFLLTAALIVGGYFAGKSYVEAKLPTWEAEFPILGVLTGLFNFDRDDPFAGLKQAERFRVDGSSDWEAVPSEIPVFEEPVKRFASVSETSTTIYQEVAGKAPKVYLALQERFQAQGWKCEEVSEGAVVCRMSGQTCSAKVVEPSGFLFQPVEAVEVWISCVKEAEESSYE